MPAIRPRFARGSRFICETAERGAVLVQQLLTVARKAAVKFEPTDINEFLRRFAELLSETFPKTMNISLELNPNLPRIMADPNRLIQALLNLCVNARDAMNGSGTLVLRDEIVTGGDLETALPRHSGRLLGLHHGCRYRPGYEQ
jgi:nitrogen-specific signal transduction histidine kinase